MTEKSTGGLFARLTKSRGSLTQGLTNLFRGGRTIDEQVFEEIEEQLLLADIGVPATQTIMESLRTAAKKQNLRDAAQLLHTLKQTLSHLLTTHDKPWQQPSASPWVIVMVGVNGVGKTTTVAKLAHQFKLQGKRVMLAAADTYRAAAIEQLQSWGKRLDIPVVAQVHGSDAAAVAHDALVAAIARKFDVLIIDTAGRQHTHNDLMEQLKKVIRVLHKVRADAPHDVFLTVDAGNGQNVMSQVQHFSQAVPVSGLCVTKLDGTAKGGVVVALAQKFEFPIRFIGVGEGMEDLQPFDAQRYVEALAPTSLTN